MLIYSKIRKFSVHSMADYSPSQYPKRDFMGLRHTNRPQNLADYTQKPPPHNHESRRFLKPSNDPARPRRRAAFSAACAFTLRASRNEKARPSGLAFRCPASSRPLLRRGLLGGVGLLRSPVEEDVDGAVALREGALAGRLVHDDHVRQPVLVHVGHLQ